MDGVDRRPYSYSLIIGRLRRSRGACYDGPQGSAWLAKAEGLSLGPSSSSSFLGTSFAASGLLRIPDLVLPAVAHCDAGVPAGAAPPASVTAASVRSPWNRKLGRAVEGFEEKVEPKLLPIVSPLYPRHVANTALRCFLLAYLPLLERFLPEEDLDDDDEDFDYAGRPKSSEPPPPLDLVKPAYTGLRWTLRELGVNVMRKVVERMIIPLVDKRTGWELTKDTARSATRKSRRKLTTYAEIVPRVGDIFVDTLKGHILGWVAGLCLQFCIDVVDFSKYFYRHRRAIRRNSKLLYNQVVRLQRRILAQGAKSIAALLSACLCAAAGSIVWPHGGYTVGYAVGDMLGVAAVNKFVDPLIIRIQKELEELELQSMREERREEEKEEQEKEEERKKDEEEKEESTTEEEKKENEEGKGGD